MVELLCVDMERVPGRPAYLALTSAETSLLVRATDDAAVAGQLLSLRSSGLLASGNFSSATAAICWLTDPVPPAVVCAAEQSGVLGASSGAVRGDWLAVVARGTSSCFNVARSGVGGAVKLFKKSVSPVSAVGRFDRAADAYAWLARSSVENLLQLLEDTVGALSTLSVPRRLGPTCPTDPHRHPTLADPALPVTSHHSVGGLSHLGVQSAEEPGTAPAAVWSRLAAMQPHAPNHAQAPKRGIEADGTRGAGLAAITPVCQDGPRQGKRHLSDMAHSGHEQMFTSGESAASRRRNAPQERPLIKNSPPACTCAVSTLRRGSGKEDGWPSTGAPRIRRCTCGAAAKKARMSMDGGVGAARNPAGGPVDDSRSVFSRSNIARIVAEGALTWKRSDHDAALAASLQEEDMHPRRCTSTLPLAATQPMRICTPWAGSAAAAAVPEGSVKSSVHASSASAESSASARDGVSAPMPPGDTPLLHHSPAPFIEATGVGCPAMDVASSSGAGPGQLGLLAYAGHWQDLCERLAARRHGLFVTGGPGVGKSTFLRSLHKALCARWPRSGDVIFVPPTGSAAKTANGQTYHSFSGFPRDCRLQQKDPIAEASRLLKKDRFRPIARRLSQFRALLLDEVSMVAAEKFDVMVELLRQARPTTSQPCMVFSFGDFPQLGPLGGGSMAFTSQSWRQLYGSCMLELSRVYRQSDAGFVQAIRDARFWRCTASVRTLMQQCSVTGEQYEALRWKVFHLMPRLEDVGLHNTQCLAELCIGSKPKEFVAVDTVEVDKDRDVAHPPVNLSRVSILSRSAALVDCVAPRVVQHCLGARVMLTSNVDLVLGLYHGSIGYISSYLGDSVPVVRFENHALPAGVGRGLHGVHDAGGDWLEVECPPTLFEARIL